MKTMKRVLGILLSLALVLGLMPVQTFAEDAPHQNTVEFSYGEKQYVMDGDTTVLLGDILDHVGISGEASEVEVSDSSLFSASKDNGEWKVTAHRSFTSTEWMKVTIDSKVSEIVVTDATYSSSVDGTNLNAGDIIKKGCQVSNVQSVSLERGESIFTGRYNGGNFA